MEAYLTYLTYVRTYSKGSVREKQRRRIRNATYPIFEFIIVAKGREKKKKKGYSTVTRSKPREIHYDMEVDTYIPEHGMGSRFKDDR